MLNAFHHIGEINQVVLNLIVNAAHAMADSNESASIEKGVIAISTRTVGSEVEICLSDTGCGMSDDIKQRIFDPFFTTKEVGRGTGQGLTMAYRTIVDQHGGSLNVESAVGEGTTFRIRLPLEESDPEVDVRCATESGASLV